MTQPHNHGEPVTNSSEALIDVARGASPTALSGVREQAMVRTAVAAARAEASAKPAWDWSSVRVGALTSLVTAAVLGGLLFAHQRSQGATPSEATAHEANGTETTLPSGDRVTSTADARWTLRSAEPSARRVEVERGAVLFDVRPLGDDESFEVQAAHVRVAVRGTVFSVERDAAVVRVRVYEGQVQVIDGARLVPVGESEMWSSGEAEVRPMQPGRLDVAGRGAAALRVSARREEPADASSDAAAAASSPAAPVAPAARASSVVPAVNGSGANSDAARPAPPTVDEARAWLAAGRPERALAAATDPRRADPGAARWLLIRADALRALGQHESAADAYDEAARLGIEPAASGYTAARIRFRNLGDAAGALRSLDAADVESGALAERALGLRAQALARAGRDAEARVAAERYLASYPEGGLAPYMRDQLGPQGSH